MRHSLVKSEGITNQGTSDLELPTAPQPPASSSGVGTPAVPHDHHPYLQHININEVARNAWISFVCTLLGNASDQTKNQDHNAQPHLANECLLPNLQRNFVGVPRAGFKAFRAVSDGLSTQLSQIVDTQKFDKRCALAKPAARQPKE